MHRLPVNVRLESRRVSSLSPHHLRFSSGSAVSSLHHNTASISRSNSCLAAHIHRRPCIPFRKTIALQQRRNIRVIPVGKVKHIRRNRFNNHPKLPTLEATPAAAYQRRLDADTLPLRTGVIAVKKGMTAVYVDATGVKFDSGDAAKKSVEDRIGKPMDSGRRIPATIFQMDRVQVVANKTREKHGYYAVVVGEGWRKPKRLGKAMLGFYSRARVGETLPIGSKIKIAGAQGKSAPETGEGDAVKPSKTPEHVGLPPKRELREFKVRDVNCLLPIGTVIDPSWFRVGQFVDARGTARGMGFAGGMKRHGFKGQPASHGVSLTHRSLGSAGGSQGSGSRVIPGKRMAGKMGGQRHTVQNLKVLMVDPRNGLVVINGAVSGRKGDLVLLSDTIKQPWPTREA